MIENDKVIKTFTKDFQSKIEMYIWLGEQNEHPWITLKVISYEEINV